MTLTSRLGRWWSRRNWQPRVEVDSVGFATIGPNEERYPVAWDRVVKVSAFKRDRVTTDEIVLLFEAEDHPGTVQEVSEEWAGFSDLLSAMEHRLGVSPKWYLEIMVPAFEPMYRVVYDRSASLEEDRNA